MIVQVLATVGSVVGVDRMILVAFGPSGDERTIITGLTEWYRPGLRPLANRLAIKLEGDARDFYIPETFARMLRGEPIITHVDDRPPERQSFFVDLGLLSSLGFTTVIDDKPYCSVNFVDSQNRRRDWTDTEIDTLRALTGVITAAITRTRQARARSKAEAKLGNRDAILQAMTDSAATLLNTEDLDTAITQTLAALGPALGLSRVHINALTLTADRRVLANATHEWFKPGMTPAKTHPAFINADVTSAYPLEHLTEAFAGREEAFFADDFPEPAKSNMIDVGMRSFLAIAVMVNGQFHSNLVFSDDSPERLSWTPTEIRSLKTVTQLVSAALTRAHQTRARSEAEAKLGNRDAILQAVTDSAANLLNAQDTDVAITETLTALAQPLGLSRVYVTTFTLTDDQRVLANISHEWFKPGMVPAKNHPNFTDADVTPVYPPEKLNEAFAGRVDAFFLDAYTEDVKRGVIDMGMHSILAIPLVVDGKFHGNLAFCDDSPERRSWTPIEVGTLKTLTQLVGAALTRAHQARERSKIEAKLGNRDAILQAVTAGAAKLLNTENPDATITETLSTLGPALGLSRIYVCALTVTDDQRIIADLTHEWFKPGMVTGRGHPYFTNADVTALYSPARLANATAGVEDAFYATHLPPPDCAALIEIGAFASLAIPVMVDGEFKGNLVFADDSPERTSWTPTEIATLKTLTQLVGAALARARYLERSQKAMVNVMIRDRALEGSSQGITIADMTVPNFPMIYANAAFAALVHYPLEQLPGMSALAFSGTNDLEPQRQDMERALEDRTSWRVETPLIRRDGSAFLAGVSTTVIRDEAGRPTHIISITEDVTELRKRDELLLEARKMASVGQLTGGIAHDFNNLLTAIKSNAEDLRDELKDDELLKMQAEIVLEAADRGAELVSQLMAFARKQELAPETLTINTLIAGFSKELQRTLPANVEIDTRMAADLPMIHIDPRRLEGAIQSLALNARDAMPDGGTITVETSLITLDDEDSPGGEGIRPGAYVLIAVTDNGTGMSPEIVDKAFTPFFTTKEVGKGSGLGLSMVYGFVKQSGGYTRIYSEVGMGTVVKLYLPAVSSGQAANEPPANPVRIAGTGAALVVEDDMVVRDMTTARLTHLGFQVVAVENAQEALDVLKATPHFDLVFSDVIMPGSMDGADLIREVQRRWPGIGVLLTSGYTATTIFAKVNVPPDVQLLSKPYSNSDLAAAIREAISQRSEQVA